MWMLGSWFLIIQMSSQGVGLSVCEAWFYCFIKAPCLINQFLEGVDAWVMVYDHPKKKWGRGSACLWGLMLLIYQNSLFYRPMSGRCGCLGPGPFPLSWVIKPIRLGRQCFGLQNRVLKGPGGWFGVQNVGLKRSLGVVWAPKFGLEGILALKTDLWCVSPVRATCCWILLETPRRPKSIQNQL